MTTVAVVPTNDLVEHDNLSEDCVCGPTSQPVKRLDGSIDWLLVHHSLDRRERNEARAVGEDR